MKLLSITALASLAMTAAALPTLWPLGYIDPMAFKATALTSALVRRDEAQIKSSHIIHLNHHAQLIDVKTDTTEDSSFLDKLETDGDTVFRFNRPPPYTTLVPKLPKLKDQH